MSKKISNTFQQFRSVIKYHPKKKNAVLLIKELSESVGTED